MDALLPPAGGSGHRDGWAGVPRGSGGQGIPAPLCGERSQCNTLVTIRWVEICVVNVHSQVGIDLCD